MTREILTQGQEIVEELDKLFKMQDNWNDAIKINQISLVIPHKFTPDETSIVNESFIDFEDLRLKVLEKIEKRVSELQEKFYKL